MMFWLMFSSGLYSPSCRSYVFSLLYRNLMVANLLGRVVRDVWDNGISKCGFSVYGCLPIRGGPLGCYVQVVYLVVCLSFCHEFQFWVYRIEVVQYVLNVHVVGVIDH